MHRIVILYTVLHGCNTSPNMYRHSDLGFWGCYMLKLLTKLNAVGRECWIFATYAWQSKFLSFRYVFFLWINSGNLFVDCMKFSLQYFLLYRWLMLLFKIQRDVCLSLFHILKIVLRINFLLLHNCIYVEMCWTICVKMLLYSSCIALSLARGRQFVDVIFP
jgi:hypothetical protein